MPVVVAAASSFGLSGYESPAELEAAEGLLEQITALCLEAGAAMGLGDVSSATVPKVSLVAPPRHGGTISTRTFIPVRVHTSIGVLGGVSVGTAVLAPGAVGASLAHVTGSRLEIEHPSGSLAVEATLDTTATPPRVLRSGVVRTARKLFDGMVFPRALSLTKPGERRPMYSKTSLGADQLDGPALTPRGKRILVLAGILVAAVCAAFGIWSAVGPDAYGPSANGCVNVTVAGSTGGATLHYCGSQAKSFCRSAYAGTDRISLLSRPQCAAAGLARPPG
jgi:hypothetical protein